MKKLLQVIGGIVVFMGLLGCGALVFAIVQYAGQANQVPAIINNGAATLGALSPPQSDVVVIEYVTATAVPHDTIPEQATAVPLPTLAPLPTYTPLPPLPTYTAVPTAPLLTSLPLNGPYSVEEIGICRTIWAQGRQNSMISPQYELCVQFAGVAP